MPQKKNPDPLEFLRGNSGSSFGNLFSMLTILKGLPLSYFKDMQDDKKLVFNSYDLLKNSIQVHIDILNNFSPNKKRMLELANEGFILSTDLADYLVQNHNLPFRKAYRVTAKIVNLAEQKGKKLNELTVPEIKSIDKKFSVEKELLLALMGIETNYGTYVGKMDIVSSLATLSFDQRRSAFFTKELLTILKLVDKGIIEYKILYGSWAGAFGYFQFMPSTIERYAIDYNSNNIIELKDLEDSFASAAYYINKIGWKNNAPCFYKI